MPFDSMIFLEQKIQVAKCNLDGYILVTLLCWAHLADLSVEHTEPSCCWILGRNTTTDAPLAALEWGKVFSFHICALIWVVIIPSLKRKQAMTHSLAEWCSFKSITSLHLSDHSRCAEFHSDCCECQSWHESVWAFSSGGSLNLIES